MTATLYRLYQSRFDKLKNLRGFLWRRDAASIRRRNTYLVEQLENRYLLSADAAPLAVAAELLNEQLLVEERIDTEQAQADNAQKLQLVRQHDAEPQMVDESVEAIAKPAAADDAETVEKEQQSAVEDVAVEPEQEQPVAQDEVSEAQAVRLLQHLNGHQFVVIDRSVEDYQTLLESFMGDAAANLEWRSETTGDAEVQLADWYGDVEAETAAAEAGTEDDEEVTDTGIDTAELPQSNSRVTVVLLDAEADGVTQISEILSAYEDISALHVLSHGAAGLLRLGNTSLGNHSLERYRQQLMGWGGALKSNGDILLYGCNVAQGEFGINFIDRLAGVTEADVAASEDDTGGASVGGDWDLEASTGVIESSALFSAATDYDALLAVVNIDGNDADTTYDINATSVLRTDNLVAENTTFAANDKLRISGQGKDDTFIFSNSLPGGSVNVDGGTGSGTDTLDFSAYTQELFFEVKDKGDVIVKDAAKKVLVTAKNIDSILGGSLQNTFLLTDKAVLKGDVTGGAGKDLFVFGAGATIEGDLDGGGTVAADGATEPNNTIAYSYKLVSGKPDVAASLGFFNKKGAGNAIVDLSAGDATGVLGNVDNIDGVIGGLKFSNLEGTANTNDFLTGKTSTNHIFGFGGNDTLTGGDGVDDLHGGDGNDTLAGGKDDDIYVFESGWGSDTVTEQSGQGSDTLNFEGVDANDVLKLSLGNAADGFIRVTDVPHDFTRGAFEVELMELAAKYKTAVDDPARDAALLEIDAHVDQLSIAISPADKTTLYNELEFYRQNDHSLVRASDLLPSIQTALDSFEDLFTNELAASNNIEKILLAAGRNEITVTPDFAANYADDGGILSRSKILTVNNALGTTFALPTATLNLSQLAVGVKITVERNDATLNPNSNKVTVTFPSGLLAKTPKLVVFNVANIIGTNQKDEIEFKDHAALSGTLDARGGNDTVSLNYLPNFDGAGNLIGGAGIDTLKFGKYFDLSSLALSPADKTLESDGNYPGDNYEGARVAVNSLMPAGAVNLNVGDFSSTEFENAESGNKSDLLIGGAQDNVLSGGDGADGLYGRDGVDTLNGGGGSDQLYGGDQGDTLTGGSGNDLLVGGSGDDTMKGGRGLDTFEFEDAPATNPSGGGGGWGHDTINSGILEKKNDILDFTKVSNKDMTFSLAQGQIIAGTGTWQRNSYPVGGNSFDLATGSWQELNQDNYSSVTVNRAFDKFGVSLVNNRIGEIRANGAIDNEFLFGNKWNSTRIVVSPGGGNLILDFSAVTEKLSFRWIADDVVEIVNLGNFSPLNDLKDNIPGLSAPTIRVEGVGATTKIISGRHDNSYNVRRDLATGVKPSFAGTLELVGGLAWTRIPGTDQSVPSLLPTPSSVDHRIDVSAPILKDLTNLVQDVGTILTAPVKLFDVAAGTSYRDGLTNKLGGEGVRNNTVNLQTGSPSGFFNFQSTSTIEGIGQVVLRSDGSLPLIQKAKITDVSLGYGLNAVLGNNLNNDFKVKAARPGLHAIYGGGGADTYSYGNLWGASLVLDLPDIGPLVPEALDTLDFSSMVGANVEVDIYQGSVGELIGWTDGAFGRDDSSYLDNYLTISTNFMVVNAYDFALRDLGPNDNQVPTSFLVAMDIESIVGPKFGTLKLNFHDNANLRGTAVAGTYGDIVLDYSDYNFPVQTNLDAGGSVLSKAGIQTELFNWALEGVGDPFNLASLKPKISTTGAATGISGHRLGGLTSIADVFGDDNIVSNKLAEFAVSGVSKVIGSDQLDEFTIGAPEFPIILNAELQSPDSFVDYVIGPGDSFTLGVDAEDSKSVGTIDFTNFVFGQQFNGSFTGTTETDFVLAAGDVTLNFTTSQATVEAAPAAGGAINPLGWSIGDLDKIDTIITGSGNDTFVAGDRALTWKFDEDWGADSIDVSTALTTGKHFLDFSAIDQAVSGTLVKRVDGDDHVIEQILNNTVMNSVRLVNAELQGVATVDHPLVAVAPNNTEVSSSGGLILGASGAPLTAVSSAELLAMMIEAMGLFAGRTLNLPDEQGTSRDVTLQTEDLDNGEVRRIVTNDGQVLLDSSQLTLIVSDLTDSELTSRFEGATIVVDHTGGDHGWHKDAATAPPADQVDLLSVLVNEVSILLNLDTPLVADDLISTGERFTLPADLGTASAGLGFVSAPLTVDSLPAGAIVAADIPGILSEAISRWGQQQFAVLGNPNASPLDVLNGTLVEIGHLEGEQLAQTLPDGKIIVDPTAAGFGWFIDGSLSDDAEFTGTGIEIVADNTSPAFGRIDLLTVLMHELGHKLSLSHATTGNELMSDTIDTGIRRGIPGGTLTITTLESSGQAIIDSGLDAFADWAGDLGTRLDQVIDDSELPFVDRSFKDFFSIDAGTSGQLDAAVSKLQADIAALFGGAGSVTAADIVALEDTTSTDFRYQLQQAPNNDSMSFLASFDLLPNATASQLLSLAGLPVDTVGFALDADVNLDILPELKLDFVFGLDTDGEFYVDSPKVTADLQVSNGVNPVNVAVSLGPIGLGVSNGRIDLSLASSLGTTERLNYQDLLSNRIDPAELEAVTAGAYDIDLPVALSGALSGISDNGARIVAAGVLPTSVLGLPTFIASFIDSIEFENFDQLFELRGISLDQLLQALSDGIDAMIRPDGAFDQNIPGINKSVNQLLGEQLSGGAGNFLEKIKNTIDSAKGGNLDSVETALNSAFNTLFNSVVNPVTIIYEDSRLLLDFALEKSFAAIKQNFTIDLAKYADDLGLDDFIPANIIDDVLSRLTIGDNTIELEADFFAGVNFGVGVDLNNVLDPLQFISDDSSIYAGLDAGLAPFDFDIALDLSDLGLGNVGFAIDDGTVDIALQADFGLPDIEEGYYEFGSIPNPELDLGGDLDVYLPLVFGSLPVGGSALDRDGDGLSDNVLQLKGSFADTIEIDVNAPSFDQLLSIGALLNDPGTVLDGLEAMFATLKSEIDDRFDDLDLPLLGDALVNAPDFIDDLKIKLLGNESGGIYSDGLGQVLQQEALQPIEVRRTTVELIQTGIYNTLGPGPGGVGGANILSAPKLVENPYTGRMEPVFGADGKIELVALTQPEDIQLVLQDGNLQFNVIIADDVFEPQFVGLDFGAAVPGFKLDSDAGLAITMDYVFGLGIGLGKDGVYVDTSGISDTGAEFALDLDASLTGGIDADLFFLEAALRDYDGNDLDGNPFGAGDTDDPSAFNASFDIDLSDSSGDGKWVVFGPDMDSPDLSAKLSAGLNIDLYASAGLPSLNLGDLGLGDVVLDMPSIETVIHYDQVLAEVELGTDGVEFDIGGDPELVFEAVTLDAGGFINSFIGPLINPIETILDPIRPFIDLLTAEIGFLTQVGATDINSIAKMIAAIPDPRAQSISRLINALTALSNIVSEVAAFADAGKLNFGDFEIDLGGSSGGGGGGASAAPPVTQQREDNSAQSQNAKAKRDEFKNKDTVKDAGEFELSLLQNPMNAIGLLLGQSDVDIFKYTFPDIDIDLGFGKTVPVFPGLNAGLFGDFTVSTDITVGFDSTGFAQFDPDNPNPLVLFNGFYLDDHFEDDGAGGINDLPEISFGAAIGATASVGLAGLIEAGVDGGVRGEVFFDFNDVIDDGKFYADELLQRIQDPKCLFDIEGTISAFLDGFLWVGLDLGFSEITLYEYRQNFINEVIASFGYTCPPPKSADIAQLENRELELIYSGSGIDLEKSRNYTVEVVDEVDLNSLWRYSAALAPDNARDDIAEELLLDKNGRDLKNLSGPQIVIRSGGVVEVFDATGVDSIIATGTNNKDSYLLLGDIFDHVENVEIDARGGDDSINLGPTAGSNVPISVILKGGSGNDRITGSDFDDVIWGGVGNDTIKSRAGEDLIYGVRPDSDSNDDGNPETANSDRIIGGADTDTIIGGDGSDFIFADFEKPEDIDGDEGDDIVRGGAGADNIVAGGGNDEVWGEGGNDIVFGQDGVDFIYGGTGNDGLYGGGGNDTLYGVTDSFEVNKEAANGRNRDSLFGGDGDDIVHGGDGDDYIAGGATLVGADMLFGHDGNDTFDWQLGDGLHIINGGFEGQTGVSNDDQDKLRAQGYQRDARGTVSDAASEDRVSVAQSAANAADVRLVWESSLETTTTLDMVGISSLNIDLGEGADTVSFDDLRNTTLSDGFDDDGLPVPAVTVALGATRTIGQEERDRYDGDGIATGETDTYNVLQKSLDSAADRIEIFGQGGVDEFILSNQPMVDPETGTGLEIVDVAQTGGVTFRLQEITSSADSLIVDGGDGNDVIDASAMDSEVFEDLWLIGGNDDDRLTGTGFSEHLLGGSGADRISGGAGVDIFFDSAYAEVANEFIDGERQIDTLIETRDANFELSDDELSIGTDAIGFEVEDLSSYFENVEFTGGDSSNSFTLRNWSSNGLLDGLEGGDKYEIYLSQAAAGANFINIDDNGIGGGIDELKYNGSSEADLIQLDTVYQRSLDKTREFSGDRWLNYGKHTEGLIIAHFSANNSDAFGKKDINASDDELLAVNKTVLGNDGSFQAVNYYTVEETEINAGGGADKIISDDTSGNMRVFGNEGDDQFFVGSIIDIDNVSVEGREVTVVTEITHGALFPMSFYGGEGDDYFEVNHNVADINLYGDNGNDLFFIKALLTLNEDDEAVELGSQVANVNAATGEGSEEDQRDSDTRKVDIDTLVYVENANVNIDGGAGFDSVAVVGTVLSDTFYVFTEQEYDADADEFITVQRIFGAGIKLRELVNIERLILLTGPGDDRVYVYGVDLGPVADMVINAGSGSDTITFGGPDITIDLNFPSSSATEYATANGVEEGATTEVAFNLGIQQLDGLPRVVPFTVTTPALVRTRDIDASQSLDSIKTPLTVLGMQGFNDQVIFDNELGPTDLVYTDKTLFKKTMSTFSDRVVFPDAAPVSNSVVDLVGRLTDLSAQGQARVIETVNDFLTNQILFEDRYIDNNLIQDLLDLQTGSKAIDIPEGVSYVSFQNTRDSNGDELTARQQLVDFLAGTGFSVTFDPQPHPDQSRADAGEEIFDILTISGPDGNTLDWVGQYREFKLDGDIKKDLIGVSLITASENSVEILPDYIDPTSLTQESEDYITLHAADATPLIFLDSFDQVDIKLNQGETSNLLIDNPLFDGLTYIYGGNQKDFFQVDAIGGKTFIHGGGGDDEFDVGTGLVDQIAEDLFLRGEEGNDSVVVHADKQTDNADALLDKNTLRQDLLFEKLSKITNALEFETIEPDENTLIADALKQEAVDYLLAAVGVNAADLASIAAQAAAEAAADIESALRLVSNDFESKIGDLVDQEQGDFRTRLTGQIEDFAVFRSNQDYWQGRMNSISTASANFRAQYNTFDFIWLALFNPSKLEWINATAAYYDNQYKAATGNRDAAIKKQDGILSLVSGYFNRTELEGYYQQSPGLDRDARLNQLLNKQAVRNTLNAKKTNIDNASQSTRNTLVSLINQADNLSQGNYADLSQAVNGLKTSLDGFITLLKSGDNGGRESKLVRLERLGLVQDVLLTLEREQLDKAIALIAATPAQSAFDKIDAFVADPTFDNALAVFNDADFIKVTEAYADAKQLAREFVDYKTDTFSDFRSVARNLERFAVFKTQLEPGFQFLDFKQSYLGNIDQLNGFIDLFDDLALEAQYQAKIRSLEFSQDIADAVVNHNTAIVDFFREQRDSTSTTFTNTVNLLDGLYTITIDLFFTTVTFDLDFTGDSRYTLALANKNNAASHYSRASGLSVDAIVDRNVLNAQLTALNGLLTALQASISSDRETFENLKDELDAQYFFLRSLSREIVSVLSDTRGGAAAAEFDDKSSLISEIISYDNRFSFTDETVIPDLVEIFKSGPGGGSVIKDVTQVASFDVLSLTGLATGGIHADHATIEKFTLLTGSGNDDVRIHDSLGQADSEVLVDSGAGADRLTLSDEQDSLERIVGNVYLDAAGDSNKLFINDRGDASGDRVSQQYGDNGFIAISGMSDGDIFYKAAGGFDNGLDIETSSGNDFVSIAALHASDHTQLHTGRGDDFVRVENFVVDPNARLTIFGNEGEDRIEAQLSPLPVTLHGNNGADVLLGSVFGDSIHGGNGDDIVVGDLGRVEGNLTPGGTTTIKNDIEPRRGGNDEIFLGFGNDIAVGGAGGDNIRGQGGDDVIFGDFADIVISRAGLRDMQSIIPVLGGNDTLNGGADFDILIGGGGSDIFIGSLTEDTIIGNYGRVRDLSGSPAPLVASDPTNREIISASMFDIYTNPPPALELRNIRADSLYSESDRFDEPRVQDDTSLRLSPAFSSAELLRMSDSQLRAFLRNLPVTPPDTSSASSSSGSGDGDSGGDSESESGEGETAPQQPATPTTLESGSTGGASDNSEILPVDQILEEESDQDLQALSTPESLAAGLVAAAGVLRKRGWKVAGLNRRQAGIEGDLQQLRKTQNSGRYSLWARRDESSCE